MSVVTLGRIALGPPSNFVTEPVGDPVGATGGAVVPAARTPQQVAFDLNTILSASSSLANAQTVRRQLRSMLNNAPLKMQAFLYLVYSDDVEQNGWLVPAPAQITSPDNNAWKAVGLWTVAGGQWYLAGRQRTMREARSVWLKDLRSNLFERDALWWIVSGDFSALPALPLTMLPHGASSVENTVNGQSVPTVTMPAGRDGGVCQLVAGPSLPPTGFTQTNLINPDLACLSFERLEAALNLSDVIVYDRRGQITAPATGADTSWEEVYGPDYPWNWLTAGQANDCPVLDNGRVRVRYDETFGTPGFRVDVWTGAAYVEQGKMIVNRNGNSSGLDDTWVSASLIEWTPDRAVIGVVLSRAADAYSRERVYVTVQRGELGATFECYPALLSSGTPADVQLIWTPALNAGVGDLNNSVLKIDSQGSGAWTPGAPAATQNPGPSPGVMASTAGTGAGTGNSGQFPGGTTVLGTGGFVGENWLSILRYPTAFNVVGAYQMTLIVLQAANAYIKYAGANSAAYGGGSQDIYEVTSQNGAGYLQCQVQFSATQAQQVIEAETMTLGTGTSVTAIDSATASGTGNNSTVANRTTDANFHVQKASWLNAFAGVFRVFARVRVAGGTGSFYVQAGGVGSTVQTTSTSYVWLDLGEFTTVAGGGQSFNLHAWNPSGSNIFVDRVEAFMVQDRTRASAIYSGSRDFAQAALLDSRTIGALTTR